jgi:hypothetical protein
MEGGGCGTAAPRLRDSPSLGLVTPFVSHNDFLVVSLLSLGFSPANHFLCYYWVTCEQDIFNQTTGESDNICVSYETPHCHLL